MTTRLPGQTGGYVVKGLAKSETACTMISEIKYVDASTFVDSKAGYSPVTGRILIERLSLQRAASRLECP
jgi:hypothetical protein